MAYVTKFTFTAPTTNADGSAIAAGETLSYNVLIDTISPPVKSYAVPAAEVATATNGNITVTFAQLGFVPVEGTTYYADVVAVNAAGTSAPSSGVSFTYAVVPTAPSGFTVS